MSQTKAQLISDLVQALNFTGTASAPANGAFLSATNTLALATSALSTKINDRFIWKRRYWYNKSYKYRTILHLQ